MMHSRLIANRRKTIAALLLLITTGAIAQEHITPLNMQEAVNIAATQNRNVVLARMDEQIAKENFRQTSAIFLPQLNVSYTSFSTNNPLNAFGFRLMQQNITQSDFNPAVLNHPDATPDNMTRFSAQQPLLNVDMLYQRKSASLQVELFHYKTERSAEYIAWQVKQMYLQLQFAWNANDVLQEALKTAQATYKFSADRFEQGLIQKSDLLNAQVQVKDLETRCAAAKSNIANASDYLSTLMNKEQGVIYRTESIDFDGIGNVNNTLPENRADFRAMETAAESYNYMVKSSRASYLPRINAFGDYQLHDVDVLGFNGNGYLAGIQLSWDVFKGFQTLHKTNILILERNKLQQQLEDKKDQGRAELSKANRTLSDAAFKIRQSREAVAQSAEALRIVQNRYEQGLITTKDVLQSQTQLAEQQLNYAQAVFEKNSAWVYIEFLTTIHS